MRFPSLETIAMFLLMIGGLNAGVNAVFDYDTLGQVMGHSNVSTVFYALVGLAAVWMFADRAGIVGSSD